MPPAWRRGLLRKQSSLDTSKTHRLEPAPLRQGAHFCRCVWRWNYRSVRNPVKTWVRGRDELYSPRPIATPVNLRCIPENVPKTGPSRGEVAAVLLKTSRGFCRFVTFSE